MPSEKDFPGDIGFVGSTRDEDAGILQVGARPYDPYLGMFLTVDPIVDPTDPGSLNAFNYARQNPITFSDPTGLVVWDGQNERPDLTNPYVNTGGSNGGGSTPAPPQPVVVTVSVPVAVQGEIERLAEIQKIKYSDLTNANAEAAAIYQYLAAYGESANADTRDLKVYACLVHGMRCGDGSAPEAVQIAFKLLVFDPESCTSGGVGSCVFEVATALPTPVKALKVVKIAKYSDEFADAVKTGAKKCSFSAATLVLMADGSKRPISEVRPGDEVLATDPETGEQVAKAVAGTIRHWDRMSDLALADGTVLRTTEDHPYWSVDDQRFVRADELEPGENVLGADGRRIAVAGGRWLSGSDGWAYNLSVEGIHTYHVGDNEILVHNKCIHASVAYQDWATKGAHVHVGKNDVRIFPDHNGGIGAEPIRLRGGTASQKDVQAVLDAIHSDPALRSDIIAKAGSARDAMNAGEYGMNVNRAAEMQSLIKALGRIE